MPCSTKPSILQASPNNDFNFLLQTQIHAIQRIKYSVKSMEVKEATHVVQDGIGDLQESLSNCTQSDR